MFWDPRNAGGQLESLRKYRKREKESAEFLHVKIMDSGARSAPDVFKSGGCRDSTERKIKLKIAIYQNNILTEIVQSITYLGIYQNQ